MISNAHPARFTDLTKLPLADGTTVDLHDYPLAEGHEDFAMLVEEKGARLGWAAALRPDEGDIMLSLKSPRDYPVTFLWFSVLGGSAIYGEMFGEGGLVGADGAVSTDAALFQFLGGLPASGLLSVVAMVLVIVFFVTSSDSGSFVVDMLASGGDPEPPVWSRIFWAVLEGLVAATLLIAGAVTGGDGLGALQTMAILLALPFSLVMIGMMVATAKALLHEQWLNQRAERRLLAAEVAGEIARVNGSVPGPIRDDRQKPRTPTGS